MKLTDEERARLEWQRFPLVRSEDQWKEILAGLSPHEAAVRIFGDLMCYTADRRRGIITERRDGFLGDVEQLAHALEAWSNIRLLDGG